MTDTFSGTLGSHQQKVAIVAEHDEDLRKTLCDYLAEQNLHVIGYSDLPDPGELAQVQPDLMLLDLYYRGAPLGLAYLREVRPLFEHARIVLMSGNNRMLTALDEDIRRLVNAVLIKPFDLDTFDQAVGLTHGSTGDA